MLNTSVVAARNPAVTSKESPGRKKIDQQASLCEDDQNQQHQPPNRMISLIPSTVVKRWTKFPIDSNPGLLVHVATGVPLTAMPQTLAVQWKKFGVRSCRLDRGSRPAQIPLACSLLCAASYSRSRWLTSLCCDRFRFSKA